MGRKVNTFDNITSYCIRDNKSGCLLYMGRLDEDGYARISCQGKNRISSDAVYEMVHGAIPEGYEVDHLCHVRHCIEPTHLRLLTHRQNVIYIKAYVEKRNQRIKQLMETYPQIQLFPLLITLADLEVLWNCGSTSHVKACLRTMSRAYPEEFFYEEFPFLEEENRKEPSLYTIAVQPSLIKRLFDE